MAAIAYSSSEALALFNLEVNGLGGEGISSSFFTKQKSEQQNATSRDDDEA